MSKYLICLIVLVFTTTSAVSQGESFSVTANSGTFLSSPVNQLEFSYRPAFFSLKNYPASSAEWYTTSGRRKYIKQSTLTTLSLLAGGFGLSVLGNEQTVGIGLAIYTAGMVFGPSVGYWTSGNAELNWLGTKRMLIRGGIALAAPLISVLAVRSKSGFDAIAYFIIGFGGILIIDTVWAIYDLIAMSKNFRAQAQKQGLASVTIRPDIGFSQHGNAFVGVNLKYSF